MFVNIQRMNVHEHEFCLLDSKCLVNIHTVSINIYSWGGLIVFIWFARDLVLSHVRFVQKNRG